VENSREKWLFKMGDLCYYYLLLLLAYCYLSICCPIIHLNTVMSTPTQRNHRPPAEVSIQTPVQKPRMEALPLELRRLLCPMGKGSRMFAEAGGSNHWNLDFGLAATVTPDDGDDYGSGDDDSSVASDGSQITIINLFSK
jgi:hypothetical protein